MYTGISVLPFLLSLVRLAEGNEVIDAVLGMRKRGKAEALWQ